MRAEEPADPGNQETNPQPQEKPRRKPISLKPEHFEKEAGLKKLYDMTGQVNWDQPMTTESAMNLVAMTIKTWQTQLMPKFYYQFFLQRCQALGSNKTVAAYLAKVRRIHKGQDEWGFETDHQGEQPLV